ncbi:hypothetical protein [Adhaeribacter pallidiroseus]|uniref:Outer membrane protein beta-barrel domain-containing protein n=1 Tax=Adhaeribacter pallidiroseus TaxID=2072847 RepID=A0A369QJH7_9BACT|nr:hypothetical protein [Adhaeribacter pallidiroseus]RDC64542.1 hypothetical protein AHMF7616_03156 [Adhaeribacter pallidiroseus]
MAKKILLLFYLVVCLAGFSAAQTSMGSKLIGGTGTLHIGTGNNKGTLLMLSPRMGQFVADDLALGASLPLSLYAYSGSTTTSVGLSPFVRGYFGAATTRLLLEGRVGFQRIAYNSDNSNFNDNSTAFTYGLGLGAVHFISEQVGLEILLSYDNSGNNDAILNMANLTGINLNVGFQIYLPSGK